MSGSDQHPVFPSVTRSVNLVVGMPRPECRRFLRMPEVARNAGREFWQPPVVAPPVVLTPVAQPGMVEACNRCETEFIPGSRFCHVCGGARSEQADRKSVV